MRYSVSFSDVLTHWTKHETRLNRDFGHKRWGDAGYAAEELVAELGAAFLCANLGITPKPANRFPNNPKGRQSAALDRNNEGNASKEDAAEVVLEPDRLHSHITTNLPVNGLATRVYIRMGKGGGTSGYEVTGIILDGPYKDRPINIGAGFNVDSRGEVKIGLGVTYEQQTWAPILSELVRALH